MKCIILPAFSCSEFTSILFVILASIYWSISSMLCRSLCRKKLSNTFKDYYAQRGTFTSFFKFNRHMKLMLNSFNVVSNCYNNENAKLRTTPRIRWCNGWLSCDVGVLSQEKITLIQHRFYFSLESEVNAVPTLCRT